MTDHIGKPQRPSLRMARRSLFKGAAVTAVGISGGFGSVMAQNSATPMADATLPPASPSVADLQAALANGDVTVREIVEASLARIAAIDEAGPALNAVIELNPDALAIADELDAELAAGNARGPMHGIPVLIKDNIATADGMQTTAGSLALEGLPATADATLVTHLRDAGVVILGKTNLSEWANIRSFQSTSGWSGRGGQTLNPYQIDRNPSGSSSGSGVAAAAGYVPVTIGTETNGSIVSPAGNNGVVGIKPTVGLVSRVGVIPISHSQDTIGPMARTVADAAALLNVLAVPDPADSAARGEWPIPVPSAGPATPGTTILPVPSYPAQPDGGVPTVDYLGALDHAGLEGARIGVVRQLAGFSPIADAVFEEALQAMAAAGAELVDPVEIPSLADQGSWGADTLPVLEWELKAGLADYFSTHLPADAPIKTLADVIAFNAEHADEEMPWFDQSIFLNAEQRTGLDDIAYINAVLNIQAAGRDNGIDAALQANQLDALVAPTNGPATRIDLLNGDHWLGGTSTLAAIAGYPLVTIPAGYRHGLPIGITFMGTAWSEETLIRLAYALEQQLGIWQEPTFAPGDILPPA